LPSTQPITLLFLVDAISSLVVADFRQAEWRIDVAVAASQKGLMLPAGLAFNALSEKALRASQANPSAGCYWSWGPMLAANAEGLFPYTPPVNLLFGLQAALALIEAEGLDRIVFRHARHAAAIRTAFHRLDLELICADRSAYSPSVTGAFLPHGQDARSFRTAVLELFNLSLATGLGRFSETAFRLAHLGDINELTVVQAWRWV
jgi:alanine-glyoxylate transaminase / serine-glyoxylate transaminase / serine-pyruvate transaminase